MSVHLISFHCSKPLKCQCFTVFRFILFGFFCEVYFTLCNVVSSGCHYDLLNSCNSLMSQTE